MKKKTNDRVFYYNLVGHVTIFFTKFVFVEILFRLKIAEEYLCVFIIFLVLVGQTQWSCSTN